MTFFVLLLLTVLLLSYLAVATNETRTARWHADSTAALHLADGGAEWAFDRLAGGQWSGGAFAVPMPGGAAAVTVAVDASDPLSDVAVVTSAGAARGATRTVETTVRRPRPLAPPGAVTFPGLRARVDVVGDLLSVSGRGCRDVLGVAVADLAEEIAVQAALTPDQKTRVSGLGGVGDATIAVDATLTSARVKLFVDAVRPRAQPPAAGWGSPERPALVYTRDPVTLPPSGYGLLVVEGQVARVAGASRWVGLVLVTGPDVGLRLDAGASLAVTGALVVNETDPMSISPQLSGAALAVQYDCAALAALGRRLTRAAWRER